MGHPHSLTRDEYGIYMGDQDYRFMAYDRTLNVLYAGHRIGYGIPITLMVICVGV